MPGARALVVTVSAISGAVTVAAALAPRHDFAYSQPGLHGALAAAVPFIAVVAWFLVLGCVLRRGRLTELALASALGTLTLSGLAFVTVPAVFGHARADLSVWASLVGSACGAVLFALAAFIPRRPLRRPGLAVAASQAALIIALLAIAILVNSLAARLPRVSAAAPQDLLASPGLHVDVALSVPKIVTAASYGAAVIGFLRRSRRSRDEFSEWLAIAAVLGAAAYVNYLLYPYSSSHLVSIGDLFRLCFYAVVLAGLAREAGSYWRAMSEAAVRQERWRIAADLHDGLAQDIAYLARNLGSGHGAADQETMEQLRQAAERAHLEVRLAIGTLAASRSQSVNAAIAQAVGEVAARDHVKLELDVVPGVRLSATRAEALVRIASEAVGNAARHSGADSVSVSLQRQGSRVRLRVSDHGTGFDPALPGYGFGLTSMHERASAVGGDLRISSLPGYGTEVEATL